LGVYPAVLPGIGVGLGGFRIDIGLWFGAGRLGWALGWGPTVRWSIFLNHSFFNVTVSAAVSEETLRPFRLAHDPAHRLGVPYANRAVAGRFGGGAARSNFGAGKRASGVPRRARQRLGNRVLSSAVDG